MCVCVCVREREREGERRFFFRQYSRDVFVHTFLFPVLRLYIVCSVVWMFDRFLLLDGI